MAILGLPFDDRENPEYTVADFKLYMPMFKNYIETQEGTSMFNEFYNIANAQILYSIFGIQWKYAMSLCIAHYIAIIGAQTQTPSGNTLGSVAGMSGTNGVITSAGIGGFSKTFDLDRSMSSDENAVWWNQTRWGQQLYNLFKSKFAPTIFVVTSNHVPGSGN